MAGRKPMKINFPASRSYKNMIFTVSNKMYAKLCNMGRNCYSSLLGTSPRFVYHFRKRHHQLSFSVSHCMHLQQSVLRPEYHRDSVWRCKQLIFQYILQHLAIQNGVQDLWLWCHLGVCQKCRLSGPMPELLVIICISPGLF